jgi:hypothetical protein
MESVDELLAHGYIIDNMALSVISNLDNIALEIDQIKITMNQIRANEKIGIRPDIFQQIVDKSKLLNQYIQLLNDSLYI